MNHTLNVPLSSLTSFKIGGRCRAVIYPKDVKETETAVSVLKSRGIPFFILGNGTNVLFPDEGYDGCIISTRDLNGIAFDGSRVTALAGTNLTALAYKVSRMGLSGLEFAYGIPGSVGGGVYMNAGAYGGELSQRIVSVTYLDLDTLETVSETELKFGYRKSPFMEKNALILSAELLLTPSSPETCTALCDELMQRRRDKQPLEYPNAGSVFKRCEGRFTGEMIEKCGLKGYTLGGAQVSEKHAGFIVNRGNATSKDVIALIEHIKRKVYDTFGVSLECEIKIIK